MKLNHLKMKVKTGILLVIFIQLALQIHAQTVIGVNDSIAELVRKQIDETPFFRSSQIKVEEESALKLVDALPAFGVFQDTYFTTGIPLNGSINRNTADAKFQISIRQRLTRSRLPFNTFLFVTYTQKSFWDIYAESSPFRDTNYNPGLGLGKYIIRDNVFKGTAFLQIEHESNGRDSLDSRSWNMLSFSTKYYYNPRLSFGFKFWIPIVDGENNGDLLDYRGFFKISMNYITAGAKWWLSAELNPRKGFGNINTSFTAGLKISRKSNQYLYAQFYNGTGDSLLDYNKYAMNIRIGFCIKPDFGSIF